MGKRSRGKYLREYRAKNLAKVRMHDRERQRAKRRQIAPFAEIFRIWFENLNAR